MTRSSLSCLATLAAACLCQTAAAQTGVALAPNIADLRTPYAGYLGESEPCQAPERCEAGPGGGPACGEAGCTACDPCGGGLEGRGCNLGDPWKLFGEDCCGITAGGWISVGLYSNARGAASNGPLSLNNVGDGFTVNQCWAYAEKATDTECCPVDWGFRADFVFGVDGPDTQAFGGHPESWDNPWDTARDYGSALPQLYGEIAVRDLKVKLGHFYTIIGYEVVQARDNFFYTHNYTHTYGEPFTHTGVLASYALTDDVTVHAGWTQGWDTGFDNTYHADTFLGGLSLPLADDATLTWACSAGDLGAGRGNVYMNSFVFQWGLTEKLTCVFQHDLGTLNGPAQSQWYAIDQYLLYRFNERWATGVRFEWFRDDDAARISFNGPAAGDYYGLTWGVNWQPHANLRVRPELRYDRFHGTAAPGALPFDGGVKPDQFSGGFDVIFTF